MERLKGIGKLDKTSIRVKESNRLVPDYDLTEEAEDEEIEY